jgi:hypothetical protein
MTDDQELERLSDECLARCDAKAHHETEDAAREHVRSLQSDGYPDAYWYTCECPSFVTIDGEVRAGPHFHVASSPVPRRWRHDTDIQEEA